MSNDGPYNFSSRGMGKRKEIRGQNSADTQDITGRETAMIEGTLSYYRIPVEK